MGHLWEALLDAGEGWPFLVPGAGFLIYGIGWGEIAVISVGATCVGLWLVMLISAFRSSVRAEKYFRELDARAEALSGTDDDG